MAVATAVATETYRKSPSAARIPVLDGIRGVASLLVVIYHYIAHIGEFPYGSPMYYVQRVLSAGWTGVDLFFVLSGFLITGILIDVRESASYYRTFYVRRICRLFPLYYTVLLAYFALITVFDSQSGLFANRLPWWPYLFYWQNFSMAAAQHLGALWLSGTWSLAIEEQFYLALPALVHRVRNLRHLAAIGAGLVITAPLLRLAISLALSNLEWDDINYVLLPTRWDALGVGMLLAILFRTPGARKQLAKWCLPVAAATALSCAAIFALRMEHAFFLSYTSFAIFYGSLLVFALTRAESLTARLLGTRPMRQLGNMSYSTYLIHPILLHGAFYLVGRQSPVLRTWPDLGVVLLALSATLTLSALSFRYIERPILAIGHRRKY